MKKAIIYLAIFLGTCWVTSQLLQFVSDMLGDLGFSATLKDDAVWFFAPYAACLFVAFKCLSPNISPKPFLENKHKFAIAGYFLLLFALIHMIFLCLLLAILWGEEIGSGKEFWNVETTYPVLYVVTVCLIGPFVEEIFFREKIEGQLLQTMNRPWVALLLSALIFTVVHISTYSAHVIFMFPVSLVICWAYYRTGTIWVGFVIHCLQNFLSRPRGKRNSFYSIQPSKPAGQWRHLSLDGRGRPHLPCHFCGMENKRTHQGIENNIRNRASCRIDC